MPQTTDTDSEAPAPFRLGDWLVEPTLNRLSRGEESVQLEPKAMDLLVFLAKYPGEVQSREAIIDAVWAEDFVGEGVLRRAITVLREALGDDAKDPTYIETISKRGYRLIAEVTYPEPVSSSPAEPVPQTQGRRRAVPWIAGVAAIVMAAASIVLLRGLPSETTSVTLPELSANRVAVVPLENRTGDASLDTLGVMAADLIVQRFTESGVAEAVPMAEALEDAASSALEGQQTRGWNRILQLAHEQGAGLLLSGATYLDGDTLRLQERLSDVATGDLVYAFEPVEAPREAATDGIDSLGDRVLAAVAAHVELDIDIAVQSPPSTYAAFQAYKRAQELVGSNWPEAVAHGSRALDIDPGFHHLRIAAMIEHLNKGDREGAHRWLAGAENHLDSMTPYERTRVQYVRAIVEEDRLGALNAARRSLELAPRLSFLRLNVGLSALFLNRPREAVDALEPIALLSFSVNVTPWSPLSWMTGAQHMLGNHEREIEYADIGRERFSDRDFFFRARARALAALGEIEAVDQVVDEFLRTQTRGGTPGYLMLVAACELRAHGHRAASDAMATRAVEWFEGHPSELVTRPERRLPFAYALHLTGRTVEARDLLLELAEIAPEDAGMNLDASLGITAAVLGDRDEARWISDGLPAGDDPRAKADRHYWRACIAAHLGERDRAIELLTESFSKGRPYFAPFGAMLHAAPELEPLWDYPPFQELIRPKG